MRKGSITMILKKENRKNIENWAFGGFSKFEISTFFQKILFFFFEFSILFRKYDTLVYRMVLWFVDALIMGSLVKESWQNLQNCEFYGQYCKILHIYQYFGFFTFFLENMLNIVDIHIYRRRISRWFQIWFQCSSTSNGLGFIVNMNIFEPIFWNCLLKYIHFHNKS